MAHRVGLGPVFAFEWLMTTRRWQTYAMRSITILLLLGAMWLVWIESSAELAAPGGMSIQQQTEVARAFFGATAVILLGLVGLAAPAAAAGSICLDKARGNLTLLFATDLSDAEIVLGKLAARLVPVLGLILAATPVLSLATLFGGIDPIDVVGTLFVVLACAVFGCTLALTLSIWGRKTHEVLMATYVFGILYLLSAPILIGLRSGISAAWRPSWLPTFMELLDYNPIFLILVIFDGPPGLSSVTLGTRATFLGLGLAASTVLVGVATWRIRRVVIRQLGRGERPSRRLWAGWLGKAIDATRLGRRVARFHRLYRRLLPRPSLDRNPVLWRECQRKRPSRWDVVLWGIYVLFCGGGTFLSIELILIGERWGRELGTVVNALQVGVGLLMLSVSAATSLSEERQRGSLDVLMATPLPTRSIVWGKWWGTFRLVPRLLILPSLLTFALSFYTGHLWGFVLVAALILAYGAAITSLGLALATWMPRMGRAVGTTVGLYTAMALGWIPLSFILFGDGPGDEALGIVVGSPPMGVGVYTSMLAGDGPSDSFLGQTAWTIAWAFAYAGVALALLLATLATFNRCLGRVHDRSRTDDDDFFAFRAGKGGPVGAEL